MHNSARADGHHRLLHNVVPLFGRIAWNILGTLVLPIPSSSNVRWRTPIAR
jgi:hypothetical protein